MQESTVEARMRHALARIARGELTAYDWDKVEAERDNPSDQMLTDADLHARQSPETVKQWAQWALYGPVPEAGSYLNHVPHQRDWDYYR